MIRIIPFNDSFDGLRLRRVVFGRDYNRKISHGLGRGTAAMASRSFHGANETLYDVLQISSSAPFEDIKSSYRQLMLRVKYKLLHSLS
jgi:hypothetical protein